LVGATCLLAYSNGANDNFKGVASLYGSGTTDYRTALAWGTFTTFLGSAASVVLAQGLLSAFSGKGLVPPSVASGELFLMSVAAGAGGTVILATILGFPISTTHSLVGAIVGAGALGAGGDLNVTVLATTFIVPLIVSPFMAVFLAGALYWVLHRGRLWMGVSKDNCVCIGAPIPTFETGSGSLAVLRRAQPASLVIDAEHRCVESYASRFVGVRWQRLMDTAHFMSAGVVSFARGLNDTPKIAALLLAVQVLDVEGGLIAVGVAIAAGGLLSARRVALTMGRKITSMNHGQGFTANIATGVLVIWASRLGLPVSTTHVSVGALFGIGVTTGQADMTVMRNVALSWLLTLPCAGALAAGSYALVSVL
jgi:PiT family inorganic phosphate transporter